MFIVGYRNFPVRRKCNQFAAETASERAAPLNNTASQLWASSLKLPDVSHQHRDSALHHTHRIDVQGSLAVHHGKHGGLTARQRSFQGVVGGIDCCFALWVLKREAGISEAVCLQKKAHGERSQHFSFINVWNCKSNI